jgi:2-alkyl-3-oxoalkanoate reductase
MELSGKTVLVTGATGFLGGHLVNRLADDGVQVKALARRPERDRYIKDAPGAEVVQGDLTDADRMREVTQGCTVIFHVGAALGGDLAHQRRVNVDGTRHVMQAAATAQVERVVHVSTISTYGYRNRADVTEDTPPDPGADPYHITKVEAEQVVREIGAAENVDYTIIRPGMIYGPRSTQWTKTFFNVAKRGIWIGDGSGSAFPIYVDDVVDLCVTAATHPAAVGEAFNCTPDPSPTWRQFLGAYQQLAGVDRWIGVPPLLLRPAVMLAGVVAPQQSKAKDLPDLLPFVTNHITYKMDKARDLLGWQPQVELSDGATRCVPYLREKGLLD